MLRQQREEEGVEGMDKVIDTGLAIVESGCKVDRKLILQRREVVATCGRIEVDSSGNHGKQANKVAGVDRVAALGVAEWLVVVLVIFASDGCEGWSKR